MNIKMHNLQGVTHLEQGMVLDINVIESLINFNGILVASITLNVVLKARHKCKNNLLNWMLSFFC